MMLAKYDDLFYKDLWFYGYFDNILLRYLLSQYLLECSNHLPGIEKKISSFIDKFITITRFCRLSVGLTNKDPRKWLFTSREISYTNDLVYLLDNERLISDDGVYMFDNLNEHIILSNGKDDYVDVVDILDDNINILEGKEDQSLIVDEIEINEIFSKIVFDGYVKQLFGRRSKQIGKIILSRWLNNINFRTSYFYNRNFFKFFHADIIDVYLNNLDDMNTKMSDRIRSDTVIDENIILYNIFDRLYSDNFDNYYKFFSSVDKIYSKLFCILFNRLSNNFLRSLYDIKRLQKRSILFYSDRHDYWDSSVLLQWKYYERKKWYNINVQVIESDMLIEKDKFWYNCNKVWFRKNKFFSGKKILDERLFRSRSYNHFITYDDCSNAKLRFLYSDDKNIIRSDRISVYSLLNYNLDEYGLLSKNIRSLIHNVI